jgi:RecB family endonuclease NucS
VLTEEAITPLDEATLIELGVLERGDLQRLLRSNISVIAPDVLVISEEFCDWEDSRRRIDLLGIDKQANLVVIELKRTNNGGHMELQAVRYAAMISTMTFERAVQVYDDYLKAMGSNLDAQESLLEFL